MQLDRDAKCSELTSNRRRSILTIHARGKPLVRFEMVVISLAAANIDPHKFSNPEALDITREENEHLAHTIAIPRQWNYDSRLGTKGDLQHRLEDQDASIQHITWKAQNRLHLKYKHLVNERGKHKNIAIGAVARELVGFVVWATLSA